jgi:putative endonuclease
MKKWVLYIVRCRDGSLYTGITTNINERLIRHSEGRGSKYIRSRRPIKLVYKKTCKNESEARKLELRIKKLPRKIKIKIIKK